MKRLRKKARELLQTANKVYHYRRDVISDEHLKELETEVVELEALLKDKAVKENSLQASMKQLNVLLNKIGGKIYPKTFWSDNLEVILVAAILVIGVRTFFFQPFIIPTNSMYPTYSGMTYKAYADINDLPDSTQKAFNKIRLGSRHKKLIAKNSGPISLLLFRSEKGQITRYREVPYRKFFIFPAKRPEYVFSVGGIIQKIQVPPEFNMLPVIDEFFPDANLTTPVPSKQSSIGRALLMNRTAIKGDLLMCFDINLGDALFVDRFSYHFKRPKVGDPFVFRTNAIREELKRLTGDGTDKYYIKRIAGIAGETLEIKDGALLVNGKLRDEIPAFVRNAEKEGEYKGYVNHSLLAKGRKLKIPENSFVALGDNSGDSQDSRFWGFVPDKSVIGKAIFIYYPFTKRWGLAE